jgi:hypothetical protein
VKKTMWLLALLSLLLIVGYDKVAGTPRGAIAGADQPLAIPAAAPKGGGKLPARYSEYVFLHQTRDESLAVHAMAGGKACPE